ncbi:MAG: translation elongation factor Ts [Anaerolineales bacterium]|nr:MAG: translation elongation factor Ts [Anaerolineales bacterium]
MAVTVEMVKELRQATQAGVLDCKKALEQAHGDIEQAIRILRKRGIAAAARRAGRTAADGRIDAYVHQGSKLASLIEVNCETDFVARTDEFGALCHDLAMQVAAASPRWLSREDVSEDVIEAEKEAYRAEMAGENKPEHIMARIIEGKLAKFYRENCLLEQVFIKDDTKTIRQLVAEAMATLGENIVVKRFARFQIG